MVEAVLQKLLDISVAQGNLIREHNADALERNLSRRQTCLEELEAALQALNGSPVSEEAKALLGRVQSVEEQNLALMGVEMQSFREKMRKNTEARRLAASYTPAYSGTDGSYNKRR